MKLFSQATLDFKTFRNATILLAILIIPMSYIHETGHAIVCASQGNEFKIGLGVNGGSLVCLGQLENPVLFYAFGGIFAAIVALIPLIKFDWIKKNRWVLIPSLSLAIAHGVNAIVEAGFNKWYLQHTTEPLILLNGISFSAYFLLLLYFGRKTR